ncbi:MAG: hypothetical protein NXI31_20070 [bacterium]|nr:hypothetical protein [bacterium]
MANGLAGGGFFGGRGYCAAAAPDGGAVVGGIFTTAGGVTCNRIARWDDAGWQSLGTGMDDWVADLAFASNGDLYASGNFSTAGGVAAEHLARWDGTAWHAIGNGTAPVTSHYTNFTAIAVMPNGDLVSDGNINLGGGSYTSQVMRWDGSTWSALGGPTATFDHVIRRLVVLPNGDLVAGGFFSSVGNVSANGIARWNGSSWSGFGTGITSTLPQRFVDAIALHPNGDLIVGGYFSDAGGAPATCIARWDGASWSSVGGGVNNAVMGLVVTPAGDILAAGDFTQAGSASVSLMARFDGAWSALGSGASASIRDMAWLSSGQLVCAGFFFGLGGATSRGAALLTTTCGAGSATTSTACVGPAGALTLATDELPWLGGEFRATCSGFAANALAVAVFGLQQQNVALASLHPTGIAGCDLLVSDDTTEFSFANGGVASSRVLVPNAAALIGVQFEHQFLQGELSRGAVVSLSSSNALTLTVGAF